MSDNPTSNLTNEEPVDDKPITKDENESDSLSSDSSTDVDVSTDSDDYVKPKMLKLADGDHPSDHQETVDSDLSIDSEDDCVTKSLKKNKVRKSVNPEPIIVKDEVSCFSFSAIGTLIAVGTVMGDVDLYDYDNNEHLAKLLEIKKPILALEWTECSDFLYVSCGKKVCLVNVEKKTKTIRPVNKPVCCIKMINNGMVTGDEDGNVRVWDDRTSSKPVFTVKRTSGSITSLCVDDYSVAATVDAGCVITFDIRHQNSWNKSVDFPAGFNCCEFYKSGTKLVCGTADGNLLPFSSKNNFTAWEDQYKPIETSSSSINCMIALADKIALTGTDDGLVRATHLYPMRRLGIVGSTQQITGEKNGSVDCMDISSEGTTIGISCATDNGVLLLNTSFFEHVTPKDPKYNCNYYFPSSDRFNNSELFSGLS